MSAGWAPDLAPGPASELEPARQTGQISALLHDARNMVAAMDLYCDLLAEPGVLAVPYRHYARELRLVAGASRRLLERLAEVEEASHSGPYGVGMPGGGPHGTGASGALASPRSASLLDSPAGAVAPALPVAARPAAHRAARPGSPFAQSGAQPYASGVPIASLAEELRANLNLISALAGPAVTVGLSISGGNRPIPMTGDDLTRVLVNLARNAAEAMPGGGHLQIALEEEPGRLRLSFTDNGPGIPQAALEAIFSPGYTSHIALGSDPGSPSSLWPVQHRGLGLSIVRSIVTAAGGLVWAANRSNGPAGESDRSPEEAGRPAHLASRLSSNPAQGEQATGGAILFLEFPIGEPPLGP